MKFFNLDKRAWQWIILVFLAIIWGSSFILMKKGLEVYSHTVVAALRISLTSIVLAPVTIKYFKKIDKKLWKHLIFIGVIGNGIPAFLFTLAQTKVSSSLSGMLNSLTPIFALLIGIILFNSKIIKLQFIGVSISLLGAIGLVLSNGLSLEDSNIYYVLLIVVATICYAISVNIIKVHLKDINSIAITSLSFLSIGPFTIIYLFTTNFLETSLTNEDSGQALIYILILSVLGTALAIILFNMLIKKTTTLFATSVTYLIPIIAVLWGIFDGEMINLFQLISIGIILLGIYFLNIFR